MLFTLESKYNRLLLEQRLLMKISRRQWQRRKKWPTVETILLVRHCLATSSGSARRTSETWCAL